MKNGTLLALVCLAVGTLHADPSKHTANYVKGHALELIDEKVSLDVAYVQPVQRAENDTYAFLTATTYDDDSRAPGGTILVVTDKEEALTLIKRYGVTPDIDKGRFRRDVDTRRLTGTLRQTAKKTLFLDASQEGVPEEDIQTLTKDLEAKKGAKPTPAKPKGKGKPGAKKKI